MLTVNATVTAVDKKTREVTLKTTEGETHTFIAGDEVRNFATKLAHQSEIFSTMDESYISRIVVLQNQERFIDPKIPTYVETN